MNPVQSNSNAQAPLLPIVAPGSDALSPAETFTRLAAAAKSAHLEAPTYLMDHAAFHRNGLILKRVQDKTGARILLAQKAFACFNLYPTLRNYLAGTAASGLHEARLGAEEFGGEVHVFSPAYTPVEISGLLKISDHLIFNSLSQWKRYREEVLASERPVSPGLRINPEYAESVAEIYNPCAPGSRFGVLAEALNDDDLVGIEGLHFHTLCEQGSDALERTLKHVVAKFDAQLKHMKWLNMGGGHLITSIDYDVDHLIRVIKEIQIRYPHLQIYLEPGEAISTGTGVLVGHVIDLVRNGMDVAVLDVSATAHMPDVLEMPYRADVENAGIPGEKPFTYRLGAPTCLSGDVIGDYSFDAPLQVGDQIVFHDMSHYTMVKNTTFNGVRLPDISILQEDGDIETIRRFDYEDYKCRLGG
ncbi:MAG: carboxynorspermidine decarboxylase [Verrucomicrobiales bacterium]|nr:carboxynorspermidine decarboxylase [Verrucomicrobiales bacterium]